ncbi:hypothetical protein M9Y10_000157 [Tritrichomonas musculus]|uniref:Uncharacterized protein n=1 Tax=Tritrichomonas musculus TaxID=1915356 RepID=A0ABR2L3I7_9EUKA
MIKFFHSNLIHHKIYYILHEACQEGDLELIKIYLSETITNESNLLSFKIDKTNRNASLFKVNNKSKQIIIPQTVKHDSTEYLITSITSIRNSIQILKFIKNSEVEKIYKNAFNDSHIKEIHFPSSLKELEDGWCKGTRILKKKIISPSNGQFIFKEDKYLLGKSDQNNSEFDIPLFACRNITEISIPSNVKIISPFAFEYTIHLRKVEFPPNSNLEIIENYAFFDSGIEGINFPASLKELKEDWCCLTENLTKVTISPSNKRFLMKDNKYLIGKSDAKKDEFDILLFACRDILKLFHHVHLIIVIN